MITFSRFIRFGKRLAHLSALRHGQFTNKKKIHHEGTKTRRFLNPSSLCLGAFVLI